ncbi:hypothetical protein GGTG_07141 [Gaeumannomyces tritici R3-111a-1]|uniref:Uncharacterized protein n=1 Tax=Gaeumannomyces tritici (strain R3-111a-1) TaxID=644352 RepID=J3P0U5_GAET3|nr:hypothetical protein GGTG_07141 [Gaeumannomyces tritici R3-111a-1]EJT77229.1 hypothetical protein GGTG_07141 [Gaeumannomyces tritici R3-111a-1]
MVAEKVETGEAENDEARGESPCPTGQSPIHPPDYDFGDERVEEGRDNFTFTWNIVEIEAEDEYNSDQPAAEPLHATSRPSPLRSIVEVGDEDKDKDNNSSQTPVKPPEAASSPAAAPTQIECLFTGPNPANGKVAAGPEAATPPPPICPNVRTAERLSQRETTNSPATALRKDRPVRGAQSIAISQPNGLATPASPNQTPSSPTPGRDAEKWPNSTEADLKRLSRVASPPATLSERSNGKAANTKDDPLGSG